MSIIGYNKTSMATPKDMSKEKPLYVPPRDVWRFTPGKDTPLPVPVNEYGLIDNDALVAAALTTIDFSSGWQPSEAHDIHHTYWERNLYPDTPDGIVNLREFRESYANQIDISRVIHNVIHSAIARPEIPCTEAIQNHLALYRIARELARSADLVATLFKSDSISDKELKRVSSDHLHRFHAAANKAQSIPKSFHFIDLDGLNPSDAHDLSLLAGFLRKSVSRQRYNCSTSFTPDTHPTSQMLH